MILINLVPQEILDREASRLKGIQAAALAGVVVFALAGFSGLYKMKAVRMEMRHKEAKAKLEALQKQIEQIEDYKRKTAEVRRWLGAIQELMSYRGMYPRFMEDLAKTLPPGVWLTSLTTSGDNKGLTANMSCKCRVSEDAAAFLRAFSSSEKFKSPSLGGTISINNSASGTEGTFSASLSYIPAPEGEPD